MRSMKVNFGKPSLGECGRHLCVAHDRHRDERVMDVGGLRFVKIDELDLVGAKSKAEAIEEFCDGWRGVHGERLFSGTIRKRSRAGQRRC